MAKHHNLDIAPVLESVLYVNEPELADRTIVDSVLRDDTVYQDHIWVYVPLDRHIYRGIQRYPVGEAGRIL